MSAAAAAAAGGTQSHPCTSSDATAPQRPPRRRLCVAAAQRSNVTTPGQHGCTNLRPCARSLRHPLRAAIWHRRGRVGIENTTGQQPAGNRRVNINHPRAHPPLRLLIQAGRARSAGRGGERRRWRSGPSPDVISRVTVRAGRHQRRGLPPTRGTESPRRRRWRRRPSTPSATTDSIDPKPGVPRDPTGPAGTYRT